MCGGLDSSEKSLNDAAVITERNINNYNFAIIQRTGELDFYILILKRSHTHVVLE